jgi:hypothetical protein
LSSEEAGNTEKLSSRFFVFKLSSNRKTQKTVFKLYSKHRCITNDDADDGFRWMRGEENTWKEDPPGREVWKERPGRRRRPGRKTWTQVPVQICLQLFDSLKDDGSIEDTMTAMNSSLNISVTRSFNSKPKCIIICYIHS